MFLCAYSVVWINLVNNDFIWSVTYSSYCSVLIRHFEKSLYKYTFEFDMKGNTSNKVRKNAPVNHFKDSNITSQWEGTFLLLKRRCSWIFFTVPLIFFFISSTIAPQNRSKRRALFSECGGAYERLLWDGWVWGWEGKKITVYSLQKLDYTTGTCLGITGNRDREDEGASRGT